MSQLTRRERERQAREAEIISAAERVFCQKGYHDASMDEIAREAQFAKGTVYQYFTNKEDLYFAVTLKGLEQLHSSMVEAAEKGKTGIEKTRSIGEAYQRFSLSFPDTFRLMNYAQYIKANFESSPNFRESREYGALIFKTIAGAIEAGKSDGSIRADIDTNMMVYSYFLLVTGFFNRLSEVGEVYEKFFKIAQGDISQFTFDLMFSVISGDPRK